MTTNQPEPTDQPVSEADQLRRLRELTIQRMLEIAADPDIKASGLAVICKYLSEAGVLASRPVQQSLPAATSSKLPFPATEIEKQEWKPFDSQPFITA